MPSTTNLGMTAIKRVNRATMSTSSAWTAIVVTCATSSWASAIQHELEILKNQAKISQDTVLVVVEDPAHGIGSGGATLNALLVIAEKLSAKLGYSVISFEVLKNARILILHQGRQYPFDTCSKAFVMLPCRSSFGQSNGTTSLTTNLEHVLNLVQQLREGSPPGLWVCSTDMVLMMSETERLDFTNNPDGIIVCVNSEINWALNHGTIVIDEQGNVENILYGASKEVLQKHSPDEKTIPLVCGIVYLSTEVAEVILSFHELSPLDCCTYMGLDSGAKYLHVSFCFDILLAMSSGLTESDFMSGNCGKAYNKKLGFKFDPDSELMIEIGRKMLWRSLSKFRLKAELLKTGYHNYWTETATIDDHINTLKSVTPNGLYHSFSRNELIGDFVIINSSLSDICDIGKDTIIQHSAIRGQMNIGNNCYVSSANINISPEIEFCLEDNMSLLNFPVKVRYCDTIPTYFQLILGRRDAIHLPISSPNSTFCNENWSDFMERTGITIDDLWPSNAPNSERTLFNAKLFPVMQNIHILDWFQRGDSNPTILNRWKNEPRLSLKEVLDKMDPTAALQYRRDIYGNICCEIIDKVLNNDENQQLIPFFKVACSEGWANKILSCLDAVAIKILNNPQSNGNLKRVLYCIADLLGCLGGNEAGIRSGPAGNVSWNQAFNSLSSGYYHDAIRLMSEKRAQWIDKPEQMLRAARHYEKAAQNIVQQDVRTVQQHIILKSSKKPPMETWVVVKCPIRIDFMGAWTDTPPQCYEYQGSNVNLAFKLFDEKPIGSKGRRTNSKKILLVLHTEFGAEKEFEIDSVEGLLDYNRPNAPAALLKASIIATGIVDVNSKDNLEEQLLKNLDGGLELHSWTNVPQGSGLGTSSILAAALSASLWTLAGKSFTRRDLIHIVLMIEQLLTSGGGWQDQVGGVCGGICHGTSNRGLPLEVKVKRVEITSESHETLRKHLVLIYTGKVRLARNILQNTIRNWYARDPNVFNSLKDMYYRGNDVVKALEQGNIRTLGNLVNRNWECKKVIAPGCEPSEIHSLMKILEPHLYGQALTGAGGGGFLCAITKNPNMAKFLDELLQKEGFINAKVYESTLDFEGISVQIEGITLDVKDD